MAETYKHIGSAKVAMVDQKWASDVNRVIVDKLRWTGQSITPSVDSVILNSESSHGLKVDEVNPTFPWVDLIGDVKVDAESASHKPTFNTYNGVLKQYQFLVDDRIYVDFHLTHDYLLNSDMYIHAHWSANAPTTGSVTWRFDISYAKGHGQQAFHEPVTVYATQSFTAPYNHMIAEVAFSSLGGVGGLIKTEDLEPDGVLIVRASLSANSMSVAPFLHYVDCHYQSTGIGTKNKAPNFYG